MNGAPLFGVLVTCGAWLAALALRERARTPWANPVLVSVAAIILLLWAADIPYDYYAEGGAMITFLLGPAVTAMAVPLYRRRNLLIVHGRAIAVGVSCGGVTGILTAVWISGGLGAGAETVLSLAPKSVTAPIAMEVAAEVGGLPPLAAALVIVTGMAGAVGGPPLLNAMGIRDPVARGLALGVASHGIGTARAYEEGEEVGAVSSVAMALNGAFTAVLLPLLVPWIWPT